MSCVLDICIVDFIHSFFIYSKFIHWMLNFCSLHFFIHSQETQTHFTIILDSSFIYSVSLYSLLKYHLQTHSLNHNPSHIILPNHKQAIVMESSVSSKEICCWFKSRRFQAIIIMFQCDIFISKLFTICLGSCSLMLLFFCLLFVLLHSTKCLSSITTHTHSVYSHHLTHIIHTIWTISNRSLHSVYV